MYKIKKVYSGDLMQVATQNVINEERLSAWREHYAAYQNKQPSPRKIALQSDTSKSNRLGIAATATG